MSRFATTLAAAAMLLAACGGGEEGIDGASPTTEAPSCPPAGADSYSGPTSEDHCVTMTRDTSGEITSFEIEITATCTLGFGESSVTLSSETETVTSDEAAPDPGTPFKMTVSVNGPIEVDASGAFQAGNLSGTITDSAAEGDYELDFTATLLEEFSCSGGPVTWSAARA